MVNGFRQQIAAEVPCRLKVYSGRTRGNTSFMSNDMGIERRALLAVLAAAAKESEELLALGEDLDSATRDEANRRLRLFMKAARQAAR